MSNQYGPALLLGALIGGAILLDDVIGPRPTTSDLHAIHAPHIGAMAPGPGENVVMFGGHGVAGPVAGEGHEAHWVMTSDGVLDSERMRVVEVAVIGDEQAEPSALAAAIRAVVDSAQAAGREPTEAEISTAIQSVIGDAEPISVHVVVDKTQ